MMNQKQLTGIRFCSFVVYRAIAGHIKKIEKVIKSEQTFIKKKLTEYIYPQLKEKPHYSIAVYPDGSGLFFYVKIFYMLTIFHY